MIDHVDNQSGVACISLHKKEEMGRRILVIEPLLTLREILSLYLQKAGHQVVLFEDYEAAVQALPQFRAEPPDVAFVAVRTEVPRSVQVLIKLRELSAEARLIMMIAREESQRLAVQRIRETSQAIVLLRPFRMCDMLSLVWAPTQESNVWPKEGR
jgi:DNA-binding response OmpR family regulator